MEGKFDERCICLGVSHCLASPMMSMRLDHSLDRVDLQLCVFAGSDSLEMSGLWGGLVTRSTSAVEMRPQYRDYHSGYGIRK